MTKPALRIRVEVREAYPCWCRSGRTHRRQSALERTGTATRPYHQLMVALLAPALSIHGNYPSTPHRPAPTTKAMALARLTIPAGSPEIVGNGDCSSIPGMRERAFEPDGPEKLIFRPRGRQRPQTFTLPQVEATGAVSALWYVPLEPRAKPNLIAWLPIAGNSGGLITSAAVFAVTGHRLRQIGILASNQPIRRLHRPGGGEVLVRSYEIGNDLFHAEMPRWEEISTCGPDGFIS